MKKVTLVLISLLALISNSVFSTNPVENTTPVSEQIEVTEEKIQVRKMLVVLEDVYGNEVYSKVMFREKENVIQAIDPYNNITPGIYYIVATSRDEFINQKLIIR